LLSIGAYDGARLVENFETIGVEENSVVGWMICEVGERVHTYSKLIIVEDMNAVALL
jgi:hypothetical protein